MQKMLDISALQANRMLNNMQSSTMKSLQYTFLPFFRAESTGNTVENVSS